MDKFRIFITLFSLLFVFTSKSVANQEDVFFEYIGKENGIPNLIVNDINSDKYNYIWLATRGGLIKYSGTDVKYYTNKPFDSLSINSNSVKGLFKDSEGNLWITTYSNGFAKYEYSSDNFKRYQKALNSNILSDNTRIIFEDSKKRIWVGYKEGIDLFDLNIKLIKRFSSKNSHNSLKNIKFIKEINGTVWIGTDRYLFKYDDELGNIYLDFYLAANELTFNDISFYNDLIILATSRGVFYYKNENGKNFLEPVSKHLQNIYSKVLLIDADELYAGTNNNGIFIYDFVKNKVKHHIFNKGDIEQIPFNTINNMYKDDYGIIWIGTSRGIFKKYPIRFKVEEINRKILDIAKYDYKHYLGLHPDRIVLYNYRNEPIKEIIRFKKKNRYRVLSVDNGTVYLGSVNGLFKINKNEVLPIKKRYNGKNLEVSELNFTKDKIIITTLKSGIFVYNRNTKSIEKHFKLNSYNSKTVVSNGKIWVSTLGEGLYEITTDGEITNYKFNLHKKNTVKENFISSISLEGDSILWIGSYSRGVSKFNIKKKKFKHLEALENNFPQKIYEIVKIDNETLWIISRWGVSRYKIGSKIIENFTYYNGLFPDALQLKKGMMFEDFYLVYADKKIIKVDKFFTPDVSRKIYINEISIFDKPQYIFGKFVNNEPLFLNHDENFFTIKFSVINYLNENKIVKYKVLGLYDNWRFTDENKISFTNLSGGKYKLLITTPDGNDKNASSVSFTIYPPFWDTPIFKSTTILVFLISIYSFYRVRTLSLKRKYEKVLTENKKKKMNLEKIELLEKELSDEKIKNKVLADKIVTLSGEKGELEKIEKHKEEESFYKSILDNTPQAVLVVNQGYEIEYSNKAALNLLELNSEENKNLLKFVHFEDAPKVSDFFKEKKFNKLSPNRIEFRISTANGFTKWVDYYEHALNKEKKIVSMLNITKRKTYEKQYSFMIDSIIGKSFSDSVLILLNKDLEFINFNHCFEKVTGFNQSDLIDDRESFLAILSGKSSRIRAMEILTDVIDFNKSYFRIKIVLRKKETTERINASFNFSPMYNSEQSVEGVIITGDVLDE